MEIQAWGRGESLIPLVGGVRRYLQLGILLQKVHVPGTASHRTGHRAAEHSTLELNLTGDKAAHLPPDHLHLIRSL